MRVFYRPAFTTDLESRAHLRYARTQHQAKADVLDSHLYAGVTWKSFRNKLVRWRGNQRKIMASIGDLIPEDDLQAFDDDECESSSVEEILALPSDFSAQERAEYDLQVLEEYELRLRIGTAFDQLETIRQAVQHRAQYIDDKKKHARGHAANAEAEKTIQSATRLVQVLAKRYNKNYARICSLRPKGHDASSDNSAGARLKQINLDTDLTIANVAAIRTLGDSKITGSWIWAVREVSEANERKRTNKEWSTRECLRDLCGH